MPVSRIEIVTLYQYDELTEKAKERARDWMAEGERDFFSDSVDYDDFIAICETMGIEIGEEGRGTRKASPTIFWSGFSSQGDGASFTGKYASVPNALERLKEHAPEDAKLAEIATAIDGIAARYPKGISGEIKRPWDRYSHAMTMDLDAMTIGDDGDEASLADGDEDALQDCFRDLANWFYRYLESDYDARQEREALEDTIRANEYTFDHDGKRKD